ncbi:spore germination protein [Thermovorax subterraneus]|nr:spore germination protein [Thermovorax subterraneus]
MMMDDDRISTEQAIALIVNAAVGVGILSLPRVAVKSAGPDCWIVVLLGGLIALLGALLVGGIIKRLEGRTLVDYISLVFGRPVGLILGVVYGIYFTLIAAVVLRDFAEVMKNFALEETPLEFFVVTLMVLSAYLIRHGLEPMVRLMVVIFPFWFIPSVAILLLSLYNADFSELLPFLRTPPEKFLQGALSSMLSLVGFEVLLTSAQGLKKVKDINKVMVISMGIVTAYYTFVVVTVVVSMGIAETSRTIWPSMTVVRRISVPGEVLERLDALAVALWVMVVFTTVCAYYFAAAVTFTNVFRARDFKIFSSILFPWIYLAAMLPENILEVEDWLKFAGNFSILTCFLLPIIILVAGMARDKWGKKG